MSTPIMFHACNTGAAELIELLRASFEDQVDSPPDPDAAWTIEITVSTGGRLLEKGRKLIFNHQPGYYRGEGWDTQRNGMIGYFSQGNPPQERIGAVADPASLPSRSNTRTSGDWTATKR
jgi:hypothetical protein